MADNRELRDSSSLQTVPSPFREREPVLSKLKVKSQPATPALS